MSSDSVKEMGASIDAIAHHYDLSNDFYRLWLDQHMIYTCALWDDANEAETLEDAQLRKIDFYAELVRAQGAPRVLDIGCGWGGTLERLVKSHAVKSGIGLTLSPNQVSWASEHNPPHVVVQLESWANHTPEAPYDAIISIGAFEHFVRPGLSTQEKMNAYRSFFECCHQWLQPGRWLGLQTIAYGNSGAEDFDGFISDEIFPESDLPRLAEIAQAIEYLFEIVILRNDRHHYARTLKAWLGRLKTHRAEAVQIVGEKKVVTFERYLRLSIHMFQIGSCDLYRIGLRRIDQPRHGRTASKP